MNMYSQFNRVFRYAVQPEGDSGEYDLTLHHDDIGFHFDTFKAEDPIKLPKPPAPPSPRAKRVKPAASPQAKRVKPTASAQAERVEPFDTESVDARTRKSIDDQSKGFRPRPLFKSHELYISHVAKRDGLSDEQVQAVREHAQKLQGMEEYASSRGSVFKFLYNVGKFIDGLSGGGHTTRAPHPHE